MNSFIVWAMLEHHKNNEARKRNTKLFQIADSIDWSRISMHLEGLYDNKSDRGVRPNCDPIMMFKVLILQQWYGLSDMEAERKISDRI